MIHLKPSTQPKVVDLFAGAGVLSAAFRRERFKVDLAVEMDPTACETYRANVGDHIRCEDVRKVSPISGFDVLVAGPPCQGFSTLNRSRHNDDRRELCLEVLPWARIAQPKVILIENVAAFDGSLAQAALIQELAALGYEIDSAKLNAADFGVAQLRNRFFLVASKIGLPDWPKPRKRQPTVRDAWKGLSAEPDGINGHTAPEPSPLALARMKVVPPKGDRRDILAAAPELAPPSWSKLDCVLTDVWGRLSWNEPSNTLRTCLQNPSKGRYIHPEQHRVMSLREAARLHSIEDDWAFSGLPTQVARQIGNSVPFNLGRAVARSLRALFD